ncbi:MAG: hypothetical protein RLY31_2713 [Bacteroidota bacterium]|jgi:polyisoprenoid-binding protein YceI
MKNAILLLLLLPALLPNHALSQEGFELMDATIRMEGTSTLHDWTAEVTKISGKAALLLSDQTLRDIPTLSISMQVRSIRSEKGSVMDNNIRKTMQADKYPDIRFQLTNIVRLTRKDGGYDILADGNLTIAGVTKTVRLPVSATQQGDRFQFKGSHRLRMTDFKLEPPVMFLGSLKTGDEVTIHFESTFQKPSHPQ